MRPLIRIGIGFLGMGFLLISTAHAETREYALTSGSGRLSVKLADGTPALERLEAAFPDAKRNWLLPQPKTPLWTITVTDQTGKHNKITSLDGKGSVREESQDRLIMEWNGLQPGDVKVTATVAVRDAGWEWNLEWEARDPGFALWDATYPEIGPIAALESVHSILPYGWGVLHHDLLQRRDEGVYPSASRAMPFIAVSDGRTGLYLSVRDRNGYAFNLFAGGREDHKSVTMGIRHDVEGMGKTKRYRLPYPVVTIPFQGDWYESAQLYRQDAEKTPWGSIPALSERKDIPRWLSDTDLWYCGACDDAATAEQVIAFARYFEVPTSVHVYQWHQIPFDDHYPEYFPAKPGFSEAVQTVQKAGIAVMPYINGRLWDSATESWKAKNAETACALNEKGEKYVEIYGSRVPLSPMCPFTPLWRNTVLDLVDRLTNEVGVKAVYIDQISAASAKRCFAENHGHPLGGGTYWIQGYRELLQQCRKRLPAGVALTTEENADPWNDLLHAWLLVNTHEDGGEIVPLYPAVYGGRAISFGFQYIQGEDFTYRYPFRLKMARAFVFGSQLGWVGSQILEPGNAEEAKFLKALCRLRHDSRDALQLGNLLPPVRLQNVGTVSWTVKNGNQEIHPLQPAVLATAWLTPGGARKIAVANVADASQTVNLILERRHFETDQANPATLLSADGKTTVPISKMADGLWKSAISLSAKSADVFAVQTRKQ